MKRTSISVKYLDNNVSLDFDLSKNTLFFGINGRGKTRALRTIQLLHDLVASNNHSRVIEILKELNLSELKIGGKNHDEIFKSKERYVATDKASFKKFINNERKLIREYYNDIVELFNYNVHFLTSFDQRRLQRSIDQIKDIVSDVTNYSGNMNDLINTIESQFSIIRRIHSKSLSEDDFYFDINTNVSYNSISNRFLDLNRHLLSVAKAHHYSSIKQKPDLEANIKQKVDSILLNLGKTTTVYISTEIDKEANILFERISLIISKINDSYLDAVWSSRSIKPIAKEYSDIKSKIEIFNKTMEKYENIYISISMKGIINFYKSNNQIDFHKLSSGERRLCIIFLTLIFIDRNIYLIDEPEMSLSLNYQSKIVYDLVRLAKSKVVMIATHAPYIYEDFSSIDGNQCIEV